MGRILAAALVVALLIVADNANAQSTFGNALTLTGDTSYVDLGNHENHGFDGDFTLSCWFKTPSQDRQRLLYRFQLGAVSGYGIFVDFGKLTAGAWFGDAVLIQYPDFTGGPIYADNQWHHVALVRRGPELRLVADGQTVASRGDVPETPVKPDAETTIGADIVPENLFFFEGQIDEVRMWNRARSETEIRATMFDTLGPAYYATEDSGIVGYYRFEQMEDLGVGAPGENDVRDYSTYARHGEFVGSATVEPTMNEDFSRPRLTLLFKNMNPHVGQQFEVRVVDQMDNGEVARHTVSSIEMPDFELWLNALIAGHSYTVDFYADLNGNGRYDSPPADHAWRMSLDPAMGNDTLTFTHNTSFTDIGWPPLIDFEYYEAIWKAFGQNSDGSTFDLTVFFRADTTNGTLDGMVEAHDVLGLFDLIQIYYEGTFSVSADTGRVTTAPGPGKKAEDDWSGLLRYSNNGRVTSTLQYDAMGMNADFSLEGTIGQVQALLSYHSDMLGLDGVILAREDSVLVKSNTAAETDELPGNEGHLAQNYPNPFRPITNIPFSMPEWGEVEIAVFDLLGRRVATLMDGYRKPGQYTIAFDASGLSSGIYTYRMKARLLSGKKISESKRLAIIR